MERWSLGLPDGFVLAILRLSTSSSSSFLEAACMNERAHTYVPHIQLLSLFFPSDSVRSLVADVLSRFKNNHSQEKPVSPKIYLPCVCLWGAYAAWEPIVNDFLASAPTATTVRHNLRDYASPSEDRDNSAITNAEAFHSIRATLMVTYDSSQIEEAALRGEMFPQLPRRSWHEWRVVDHESDRELSRAILQSEFPSAIGGDFPTIAIRERIGYVVSILAWTRGLKWHRNRHE